MEKRVRGGNLDARDGAVDTAMRRATETSKAAAAVRGLAAAGRGNACLPDELGLSSVDFPCSSAARGVVVRGTLDELPGWQSSSGGRIRALGGPALVQVTSGAVGSGIGALAETQSGRLDDVAWNRNKNAMAAPTFEFRPLPVHVQVGIEGSIPCPSRPGAGNERKQSDRCPNNP